MNLASLTPANEPDLEAAVLGALLVDGDATRTALQMISSPAVFYTPAHAATFRTVSALFAAGKPIDMVTVLGQARADGCLDLIGGAVAIQRLTSRVVSAANVVTHILQLLELYTRREIMRSCRGLLEKCSDRTADPLELLATSQNALTNLAEALSIKRPRPLSDLYGQTIDDILLALESKGLTGVPSGLWPLDKVTGGWQGSDLIIIAGRPGMGKTTVALAFARNAVLDFGSRGIFFSLEMGERQLTRKLIATEGGYTTSQLQRGYLDGGRAEVEDLRLRAAKLSTPDLIIDETPGISLTQLRAKCATLNAEKPIKFIIIDYLQLMTTGKQGGRGFNREQEISEISRGLKGLAKEMGIPVIALAQLSREGEKAGGDHRPKISHLRESGAIEQDADMVIFPFRPEYYGITEDAQGNPTANVCEFIIAKHRNGAVMDVPVGCDIAKGKYWDLEHPPAPQPAFLPAAAPNALAAVRSDFDRPFAVALPASNEDPFADQ